jgi:hypothetical protein
MTKLEKAIEQVVLSGKTANLKEAADQVRKLYKTKLKENDLLEKIENFIDSEVPMEIALRLETDELFNREQLFGNTSFRIQLTQLETEQKYLIIGHRMIPFLNPEENPRKWTFTDPHGNTLPIKKKVFGVADGMIYISLIPPYGLDSIEMNFPKNTIGLQTIDLSKWMKSESISVKDQILVTPVNYSARKFRLEKIDSRELAAQKLITRQKDDALSAAIGEALDNFTMLMPIDISIFWAFANCDPSVVKEPGSPIGPFLSQHPEYKIFNEGASSFLQREDYFEKVWDDSLAGKTRPSLDEMGTATDIDGIMNELGSSYNENFVKGLLILQLHENGFPDLEEVFDVLFRPDEYPFYNDDQEENYDAAIFELSEKIQKEWGGKKLGLPMFNLLSKAVAFKKDFVGLLREIDDHLTDPENFDFSALMELQPIDIILDQIISFIVEESAKMTPNDAEGLAQQLKTMREGFLASKEQILKNLFE